MFFGSGGIYYDQNEHYNLSCSRDKQGLCLPVGYLVSKYLLCGIRVCGVCYGYFECFGSQAYIGLSKSAYGAGVGVREGF